MGDLMILASEVGADERTLRRAVNEGTLHATRPTPRTLRMSLRESRYIRRSWPLLASLRAALRTEPNVRFALLFGSAASGHDTAESDVDILVALRNPSFERVVDLGTKLSGIIGRRVDVVRLEDAEVDPAFLADVVAEGRVLVDREHLWRGLQTSEADLRRRGRQREARRTGAALAGIDRLLVAGE